MRIEFSDTVDLRPRICVFGVGGAGGNAVNNMIMNGIPGVDLFVLNTDAQSLFSSVCENKLQIGSLSTRGLGTGSNPEVGRASAEESREEIKALLEGCNMLFITAGMGGGTGTGASSVIAEIAKGMGILVIAVVTKPFLFEGSKRMEVAELGLADLELCVDTLIIVPNQNLFRASNEKTTLMEAFRKVDDILFSGVKSITDLIVTPGLINLDFADICTIMHEKGRAMMGVGTAEGEKRAENAAIAAISNPLLDIPSIKGAKGILINITGGMDLTLFEVDEAATRVKEEVSNGANIIFGSVFDSSFQGKISVSVVATGINNADCGSDKSNKDSNLLNELKKNKLFSKPTQIEEDNDFADLEVKFGSSPILPAPVIPRDDNNNDSDDRDDGGSVKTDQIKAKKKTKHVGDLFDIPAFFRKKNLF